MTPTIKDLAREAGVSLATVDRVLNDRPGVKDKTVQRVFDAISRIGYVRNASAANLARRRNYEFVFVLPATGDQFLEELRSQVQEANATFASERIRSRVINAPVDDPHKLARMLHELDVVEIDGVAIMAPESPQVRDAVVRLVQRNVKVVRFLSGRNEPEGADFVGVDNVAAGATAGRLLGEFSGGVPGKILVVSETMHARDSIERRLGFDALLAQRFPKLHVLPTVETFGKFERTQTVVANAFANSPDIVGVYVASSEARMPIKVVNSLASKDRVRIVAHERTPFTIKALRDGALSCVIAQNPGHVVRSAMRILKARCEMREPVGAQDRVRIEVLLRENL